MNWLRRLFRDRVAELVEACDAAEQRLKEQREQDSQRLRAVLEDWMTPLPPEASQRERDERLIADAVELELMEIALRTCDDCLFWDNDADRAEFRPCARHEGLFTGRPA